MFTVLPMEEFQARLSQSTGLEHLQLQEVHQCDFELSFVYPLITLLSHCHCYLAKDGEKFTFPKGTACLLCPQQDKALPESCDINFL